MAKQITVTYGENRFLIEALPGYQALVIHQRLLRHAIPAVGAVIGSLGGLQALFQDGRPLESALGELKGLGGAAMEVMAAIPEDKFLDLQRELFAKIRVFDAQGKPMPCTGATFDTVFSQDPESVYLLMWESINLNYSRFLERFRSALAKRQALQSQPAPSESNSPQT